jgi:hypothetical protein
MGLEYPRSQSNVLPRVSLFPWGHTMIFIIDVSYREDECVDPYLHKVAPINTPSPARKAILVTLPSHASLGEHNIPATQPFTSPQRQRDRCVSVQTLPVHMILPAQSYRPSLEKTALWESESVSSSGDGSGMDDDWRQFRVEWIDFDGDH